MELQSIAFIPDGNRRYAQKAGISLIESYQMGTQKAWNVLDWLVKYPSIKAGTFFTLSLENLSRTKQELNILFKIFDKELDKVKTDGIFEEHNLKLNCIGRTELFPEKLRNKMKETEKYTENFGPKEINLALGYNGQTEIIDAAKKLAQDYKNNEISLDSIDETSFGNYLYGASLNPDFIIRTSGTQRLSGFLTYQSAYSELYFSDKFWPEFQESDLKIAVDDFYSRQRKFGK
ncbi:MAG: polyprenyl diphosphate synthase [Candidatus Diapherotrites archaeon]